MPMTFQEAVSFSKDPLMPGVVQAILDDEAEDNSNLISFLDYEDVDSLAPVFAKLNSEGPSTGVGFRAINSTFPEGVVSLIHESVQLGEIGGDIQLDLTLLKQKTYASDPQAVNIEQKAKLIKRVTNDTFVNGDRGTNPNAFNGIRKMVDPNQVLNITSIDGTATNGIAVGPTATTTTQQTFLRALDRLTRMVGGAGIPGSAYTDGNNTQPSPRVPNVALLMNEQAMWALDWACREKNLFNQNMDQFGRVVRSYKGIPIMNPGTRNAVETYADAIIDTNTILTNNRTFGTSTDCCEIYAIRKGDPYTGLCFVQLQPLTTVTVMEHMEAGPAKLIRMMWTLALWRPKKANIAVLKGIRANT